MPLLAPPTRGPFAVPAPDPASAEGRACLRDQLVAAWRHVERTEDALYDAIRRERRGEESAAAVRRLRASAERAAREEVRIGRLLYGYWPRRPTAIAPPDAGTRRGASPRRLVAASARGQGEGQ